MACSLVSEDEGLRHTGLLIGYDAVFPEVASVLARLGYDLQWGRRPELHSGLVE